MFRIVIAALFGVSMLVGVTNAAAGTCTYECSSGPDVTICQLVDGDLSECDIFITIEH